MSLSILISHKHLHAIDFKHADVAKLPDFVRIQQFHASCTLIEVVAKRDAAVPALDFTRACPLFEVYEVRRLKHTFERGDVNSVGHYSKVFFLSAAMRTAREPMRKAAERKDCPKGRT